MHEIGVRTKAVSVGETYLISERFDKAMKLIRGALSDVELEVVREFDVIGDYGRDPAKRGASCKLILVDCPLLAFEALALDRAACVFFPLHVLVSAHGDRTDVFVANPTALLDIRPPAGAAAPVDRLHARVTLAMEAALLQSGVRGW